MIFATVGTHGQPFARFIELLRPLGDRVVLQYGHNAPPAGFADARPFLSFAEVVDLMHAADAVVTHAGVGSVLCARDAGHVPVVVPRVHRLGEHVDDHQVDLTRTLEERGQVIAVWDDRGMSEAVDAARGRRGNGERLGERPLHAAVRDALLARARR